MALSQSARRRIMRDDARRRMARDIEQARELILRVPDDPNHYCESRNLTGAPTEHNRTYRATPDCWRYLIDPRDPRADGTRGTRTIGTMRAVGATPMGLGTVKVTRDGKTSYAHVREFRAERTTRKNTTTAMAVTRVPESARIAPSARDAQAIADGIA